MSRDEFTKATKRLALKRSGAKCEATGYLYGRDETRCNWNLGNGVDFDHVLACSNGGDNSLSNCLAVCIPCHKYKTANHDTPRAAKIKRVSDKFNGIVKPKGKIKSRGFKSQNKSNDKQTTVRF